MVMSNIYSCIIMQQKIIGNEHLLQQTKILCKVYEGQLMRKCADRRWEDCNDTGVVWMMMILIVLLKGWKFDEIGRKFRANKEFWSSCSWTHRFPHACWSIWWILTSSIDFESCHQVLYYNDIFPVQNFSCWPIVLV